mgnify:CR=1 FL=1
MKIQCAKCIKLSSACALVASCHVVHALVFAFMSPLLSVTISYCHVSASTRCGAAFRELHQRAQAQQFDKKGMCLGGHG